MTSRTFLFSCILILLTFNAAMLVYVKCWKPAPSKTELALLLDERKKLDKIEGKAWVLDIVPDCFKKVPPSTSARIHRIIRESRDCLNRKDYECVDFNLDELIEICSFCKKDGI